MVEIGIPLEYWVAIAGSYEQIRCQLKIENEIKVIRELCSLTNQSFEDEIINQNFPVYYGSNQSMGKYPPGKL